MKLTDEQREQAKVLWKEGKRLGEIAAELRCSVYDLTPWIYLDELP